MTLHMTREIEKLKKMILALSAVVEDSVYNAVNAIDRRDGKLAEKTVATNHEVNIMEIDVEEECLKILALHHPVATDLRYIVSIIKINSDLERISDLASNIAERAVYLSSCEKISVPFRLQEMAEITLWMLKNSIDALVNYDPELAKTVCHKDDDVDAINRDMYDKVKKGIQEEIVHLDQFVHLLCVSRHLERIADHAVSIAEDILYMIEGKIVRHTPKGCCESRL